MRTNDRAFKYYAALRRLGEYIERNSTRGLSLGKAAEIAGMETHYFSTFFREKVGVAFSVWRGDLRIRSAKELMRSSDYAISEVAFRSGYNELRTFERAFKKRTGLTPREFKRRVRA